MEQGAAKGIRDAEPFTLEGVEFVPSWNRPSVSGSLSLLKSAEMVELYRELLAPFDRPRMVELGISQGGSVALLGLMVRPTKFVAVELAATPVEPLLEVLGRHGLTESVKPYFGVDQADKDRLAQIVGDEFGGEPLDVVIDDASHIYGCTVASFEVLFPLLRPGGVYVIEDWTCNDLAANAIAAVWADESSPHHERLREVIAEKVQDWDERQVFPEPPLSRIAVEVALARATSGDAIADVRLDENWIVIHRGPAAIDPAGFRIHDLYPDHYSLLAPLRTTPPDAG